MNESDVKWGLWLVVIIFNLKGKNVSRGDWYRKARVGGLDYYSINLFTDTEHIF